MPVKLIKPHTHAGRKYPAGATLSNLRPDQEEWLVAIKTAEPVATAQVAPVTQAAKTPAKAKE